MHRSLTLAVLALVLSACTPPAGPEPTSSPVTSATPTSPVATTTSTNSPTQSPSPEPELPPGIPPIFEDDVPSADVPPAALVPLKTEVTGSWYAATTQGEAIVVAWLVPGPDPFRLARGIAAWRRFDDGGAPWRPVFGRAFAKADAVLAVSGLTGDVTGDASDDLLFFAETGGSGGCGTYVVVDLAVGMPVFERDVCDTRIEPSASPAGLLITEAVYEPGDPHCCPTSMRQTLLVHSPEGEWEKASETVTPAA